MKNKKFILFIYFLCVFATCCLSNEFKLRHDKTGKELGPYECSNDTLISVANAVFTVVRKDENSPSFHLKHQVSGKLLGPFQLKTNAPVLLGSTTFTIIVLDNNRANDLSARAKPQQKPATDNVKYPGLPALTYSNLLSIKPEVQKKIQVATEAAVKYNLWNEHLRALDQTILDITSHSSSLHQEYTYEQLIKQPILSAMIMQSTLIRQVTPRQLSKISTKQEFKPFLNWLMSSGDAMESFLSSVKKKDNISKVFSIWAGLWANDPKYHNQYHRLALACALIFDKPQKGKKKSMMSATEVYINFRDADIAHKLKTNLDSLPAWELVWVVDLPITPAEIEWARKNVKLSCQNWSKAYSMVKYRMDRAVNNADIYDQYILSEILEKGGICGDQAYFAAMTAKANGIPAMKIVGAGKRGQHAWFGYKESAKAWNIEAGRYTDDHYATGTAKELQTGQTLKEHELKLLTDIQKRTTYYPRGTRLTWLSQIFTVHKKHTQAGKALKMAIDKCTRHTEAWDAYINYLKISKAPLEKWQTMLTKMRTGFRKYPDMIARANNLESNIVMERKGPRAAAEVIAKQVKSMSNHNEERTDLTVYNIIKQTKMLVQANAIDEAESVYLKALKEQGRRSPCFQQLALAYFSFSSKQNHRLKAVTSIHDIFNDLYDEPNGDYFAINNYANLMKMISKLYLKAGDKNKANELKAEINEIMTMAKKKYKE